MDFEALSRWFGLISLVLSVVTAFWTLVTKSTKPFDDKLSEHGEDLKSHDRRIQSVEERMQYLPSKDEVHQMQLAMTEMKGSLSGVSKSLEVTERTVRRIDEYLREAGK
jgi:Protein of unknown function (DUF2730)